MGRETAQALSLRLGGVGHGTFSGARRSRRGAVGRYEAQVLPRLASSGFCRYVAGLGACCHRGAARRISLFLESDRLGRRVSKHRLLGGSGLHRLLTRLAGTTQKYCHSKQTSPTNKSRVCPLNNVSQTSRTESGSHHVMPSMCFRNPCVF